VPWFQSVSVRINDFQCCCDISWARCDILAAKAVTIEVADCVVAVRSGRQAGGWNGSD
jgi:hypothetical protein